MSDTKRISLEELQALKASGDITGPKTHAGGEDLPDDFWDDAELVMPKAKTAVSMRVDPDVLDFFKEQGSGHLTRMHAVLRAYVDAQKRIQN
ncbi:uncharacterized protein (DUF4415 family) [Loktanella ponticola]|uniref:Uncharacterized protein (DUF4415 family) n=1 Tax=Yoonia ponticola TaxID=1524255 RepID=A0A7W9EWM2_9RHOB|nr:BrnA antitoxin family protein [Yoonia ponticola]MBB5720759.1 uncharacterized protein (DUF4415 family) [Yoonia ponticola]